MEDDELFPTHLRLDVGYFGPRELELVQRHLGLLQITKESQLFGSEKKQGMTLATLAASRTSDAVNVFLLTFKLIKCS